MKNGSNPILAELAGGNGKQHEHLKFVNSSLSLTSVSHTKSAVNWSHKGSMNRPAIGLKASFVQPPTSWPTIRLKAVSGSNSTWQNH